MRKLLLTLCISISLADSSFTQIDNGTNYILDSKTKKIATKSQCDKIFTKKGDVIDAIIKDTLKDVIKYKICKDYITNATVYGGIISLPTYEIEKIIYSNQSTKYYKVERPILRSRNEKLKSQDINPKESLKKNFLSTFMKQNSPPTSILNNSTIKSNTKLDNRNFIFISGGFGNQYAEPLFSEIGYFKRINKKFTIGSSFNFIRKPASNYGDIFVFEGVNYGPYTQDGSYVGTVGYNEAGIYNGTGPYNYLGNYIGYNGGYSLMYGETKPEINYFSMLIDFKFNFLSKKRVQPYISSSIGGSYRYVGYSVNSDNYSDGFVINGRISTGLDIISKNSKWILSPFICWTDQSYIDEIIAIRLSYGL